MLHSADFKTTILTICSVKKKKEERKEGKIFCCEVLLMFETQGGFQKKPAWRENKILHFNFFTCFSETEIQAVVWFDQICIFPVAVLFLSVFISRFLSSQGFVSLRKELQLDSTVLFRHNCFPCSFARSHLSISTHSLSH